MSRQAPTRKALLYLECAKSPWCFHRGLVHHVCEHQSSGGYLLQDSCPPWHLPSFEVKEQLHPCSIHKLELETAYMIARVPCHTCTHISGHIMWFLKWTSATANSKAYLLRNCKLSVLAEEEDADLKAWIPPFKTQHLQPSANAIHNWYWEQMPFTPPSLK